MTLRKIPDLTDIQHKLEELEAEQQERIARLVDPVGTHRAVTEAQRDLKRLGLFRANNE